MHSYLSVLVKTALNHLISHTEDIEVKRASAYLLFKIIQNCDFYHYKNYAKQIINVLKLKMENNNEDNVLLVHVAKSVSLINEYVNEFYGVNRSIGDIDGEEMVDKVNLDLNINDLLKFN
jgi:hypothetical protein